eukprot:609963-Amphidinium_carterae.1
MVFVCGRPALCAKDRTDPCTALAPCNACPQAHGVFSISSTARRRPEGMQRTPLLGWVTYRNESSKNAAGILGPVRSITVNWGNCYQQALIGCKSDVSQVRPSGRSSTIPHRIGVQGGPDQIS